jgi:4-carboxymuconolactone decarboxylase
MAMLVLSAGFAGCAQMERKADMPSSNSHTPVDMLDGMRTVSPALERYTSEVVLGDLWTRPQLSALDSGVKPGEISEIITHLAFYSGWANASSAVKVTNAVFERRGITAAQLPPAIGALLPLDQAAEAQPDSAVAQNFDAVAPGVVQFTRDALFLDLWLRPGLAPRDRSLVTVSALVAAGQVAQLTYHLNRAMDNGLTKEQASEVMTQLAFYTGWPNVFTALPVVKDVLAKRAD